MAMDEVIASNRPAAPLLVPSRTCWRLERAARLSFLIDGDAYYRALRDVFARARHSIFIVAWDIDSRTVLVPDGAGDGLPEPLGDFLDALVRRQKSLRIYALGWDFAMLYAFEREWLPVYKLDWRTHRRCSFRLDATHPLYASHHQKVIVVDDAVAFVGGLDITQRRWDTTEHRADEPRRRDPAGVPYAPFHDVQAVVDGNAARALGELVRERWVRSGASKPRAPLATPPDLWPRGVETDLDDVDVAIVRTEPPFEGRRAVHEVRELHLDAIARARRFIFMENQYFTSGLIADALAARLREPARPPARRAPRPRPRCIRAEARRHRQPHCDDRGAARQSAHADAARHRRRVGARHAIGRRGADGSRGAGRPRQAARRLRAARIASARAQPAGRHRGFHLRARRSRRRVALLAAASMAQFGVIG